MKNKAKREIIYLSAIIVGILFVGLGLAICGCYK